MLPKALSLKIYTAIPKKDIILMNMYDTWTYIVCNGLAVRTRRLDFHICDLNEFESLRAQVATRETDLKLILKF